MPLQKYKRDTKLKIKLGKGLENHFLLREEITFLKMILSFLLVLDYFFLKNDIIL